MNTTTPTGDGMSGVPAWLPDEETLTRLANEFFTALPGQASAPAVELASPVSAVQPNTPASAVQSATAVSAVQPATGLSAVQPAAGVSPVQPAAGVSAVQPAAGVSAVQPATAAAAVQPATAAAAVQPATAAAAVQPATAAAAAQPPAPLAGLAAAGPEWPGQAYALPDLSDAAAPSFYFVDYQLPAATPATEFPAGAREPFDVEAIRRQFPILSERINGRRLVWLDNAATTQKPQVVIDRLGYFYSRENSNVHRAAHTLAARATDAFESARATVAGFIGAPSAEDIIFTRGATEAINLVAQAWGRRYIGQDDEIVLSQLEHHSNIVPWQQLAEQTGAKLKIIPVDADGQLVLDAYTDLLTDRTRLVAVSHVSNVLGTIVPVGQLTAAAHRVGARVLIDGAQAIAHLPVDMQALDADFYAFSGHKVFAPTGIGVLYGKPEVLETMPPWQGGGNMIRDVTFERTTYQQPPARFEAGTGSIADAVALGTALDYVARIGVAGIARYEHELLGYATTQIQSVPGLRLIGTSPEKASVLTFVLDGCSPEETGSALDNEGIAVRSGHHCAQPILRRYGLESAVRASLAMYNTRGEVDILVRALHRLAANAAQRR
jgi:cysteine desulfurase/selenocysteine lyase